MTRPINFFALMICLTIVLIGCSWSSRRVKLGEPFSLRPKEVVQVAETGLTVRLDEVGHQTYSGPKSGPAAYCVLQISSQSGARSSRIGVGESTEQGEYVIKVKAANPFRSDDGPRCELIVNQK